jgi:phosphotransferase system enzyme I (PtsI)
MSDVAEDEHRIRELTGVPASPGIALGRAYHLERAHLRVPHHKLAAGEVDREITRLVTAMELSRHQLSQVRAKLNLGDHLQIIDAHLALFQDPELFQRLRQRITDLSINAEWAVAQVLAEVVSVFEHVDDAYLRERGRDFDYFERRLLINLMGVKQESIEHLADPVVLVAHDLSPADLANVNREKVLGILTDVGTATSHTAILARAMEIPTIVGLESITGEVKTGDLIVLDGFEGKVFLNPSLELIAEYDTRREFYERFEQDLRLVRDLPAETADGVRLSLAANIELPSEIAAVKNNGLTRIGLFRTEFLFIFSAHPPTEDEQYEVYRQVVERMGPDGVTTIRTIDLGGDKASFAAAEVMGEANPAMGLRAIRLCLAHPDIFRTQLRAILRASAHGAVRIMFPMISGIDELRQAKALLAEVREELRQRGAAQAEKVELGVMIETPAAVLVADMLAAEVDYFSIGTNDLIQYTLAVDRANEHINYLFHPLHPAVLRAIRLVVRAAREAGIPVAMCGEMAGQLEYTMALVGLGVTELSMAPNKALHVKRMLGRFTSAEARELVEQALTLHTSSEVNDLIVGRMHANFPEEFELEKMDRDAEA